MYDDVISRKHKNGTVYSASHMYQVLKARQKRGLPCVKWAAEYTHKLIGKQLLERDTGSVFTVIGSKKEWFLGWFSRLVLRDIHGRETIIEWEPCEEKPCGHDDILSVCKKNKDGFEVITEWD